MRYIYNAMSYTYTMMSHDITYYIYTLYIYIYHIYIAPRKKCQKVFRGCWFDAASLIFSIFSIFFWESCINVILYRYLKYWIDYTYIYIDISIQYYTIDMYVDIMYRYLISICQHDIYTILYICRYHPSVNINGRSTSDFSQGNKGRGGSWVFHIKRLV